jgi:hypothetical protein
MRHYCTVSDSKYLPKLLVMYKSLRKYSSVDIMLDVLALDEDTQRVLDELGRDDMLVTSIESIGLRHKDGQPWPEFCWSCASQFADHLLKTLTIPDLTYLDADEMYFSDPEPIFEEIGDKSIGVVEHRLIPSKKHLAVNGRFNVAFNFFKNNAIGRECLSTWAAQVRERCDSSTCGDQKFLDSWPAKYGDECHVVQHIGADTAPWNLGNWNVTEGPCVDGQRIIFHHYHEFCERPDGSFRLTNYDLRPEDIEFIYRPFVDSYRRAQEQIGSLLGNAVP